MVERSRPLLLEVQSASCLSSATGTALLRFVASCKLKVCAELLAGEKTVVGCTALLLFAGSGASWLSSYVVVVLLAPGPLFSLLLMWLSRPLLLEVHSAASLASATGTALLRFVASCRLDVVAWLRNLEKSESDCFAFLLMVVDRRCCGTSPAVESCDHCARSECCLLLIVVCAASSVGMHLLVRKPCGGSTNALMKAL
jgi:hypothetical protein